MEAVLQRLPTFFEHDPAVCPMDHQPCPDEHDVDLRILREITDEDARAHIVIRLWVLAGACACSPSDVTDARPGIAAPEVSPATSNV